MAYERDYKVTKSTGDLYKFYKEKANNPLPEDLFKKVLYDLNKNISDLIITKAFEYKLPFKLGFLRVKKSKLRIKVKDGKIDYNKNMVDWAATLDYWEEKYGTRVRSELKAIKGKRRIYQLNEHSNGDIMRWFWDKQLSNVPNNTVYKFKPVKGGFDGEYYLGRVGLGEWVKLGNYDYFY